MGGDITGGVLGRVVEKTGLKKALLLGEVRREHCSKK
jgi:hypothetical protein